MPLTASAIQSLSEFRLTSRPRGSQLGQNLGKDEAATGNEDKEGRLQEHLMKQARKNAKEGQEIQPIRFQASLNNEASIFSKPLPKKVEVKPEQKEENPEKPDSQLDIDFDSDDINMSQLEQIIDEMSEAEDIEDVVETSVIKQFTDR